MNGYSAAKSGVHRTPTDLFNASDRYPQRPGHKELGGASEAAAKAIAPAAHQLQSRVLGCIREHGPRTADEIASLLGEDRLSIRPRVSELRRKGLIKPTATRRPNTSGTMATVWQLVENGAQ
jgi:hypothetical protein